MAKTDQELAQEEIDRQYMYGGLGPFSRFLAGERREILRPESTQVLGMGMGPQGSPTYTVETIPAQYGPVEYDSSFSPARRGLSALGEALSDVPAFFGLEGPDEQIRTMSAVGSSLRDALVGMGDYAVDQVKAAAAGGEFFDPASGTTTAFDPTAVMFGGNPAQGAALGSGLRAPRGNAARLRKAEDEYIRSINPEGVRLTPDDRPNLVMGDMSGMAPRNATEIMRQDLPSGKVVRYVQGDDGVYALSYNPGSGEEDVIGYMLGRYDGTELAVVNEMQGQGIGGNLSYLYRSKNPMVPSGGLTEAGEAAARSAYRRMLSDRSRPDFDMDTTYYHGTSSDFDEFVPSEVGDLGPGIYITPNPEKASGYAGVRRFMRRDTNNAGPNVMPLRIRKDLNFLDLQGRAVMPFDADRIQRLRDAGYDGIRQIDELGNVNQLNIFDPTNIRSVNAEFKPGESANILYSGGNTGTTIATGSALRNLLAEQFPTDFDPRTVEAYTGANLDPRIFKTGGQGKPRANPAEMQSNLALNVQYGDNRIQEVPTFNLEDYEGYGFMSPIADTSGAGDVIKTINDVPVNVSRRGGVDFMIDPESGDLVWSSDKSVIGDVKNPKPGSFFGVGQRLKKETGRNPLLIPHSMTPTGVDFSQTAQVMLNYAKNNMNKTTTRKLDRDIKKIYPDWKGLNTEGAIDELGRAPGPFRKKIIQLLDKDYRDRGSLNAGQARLSIIDEQQRMLRPGTALRAALFDVDAAPMIGEPHPIYNTGIYGDALGSMSVPVSVYELNPPAAYLSGIRPEQLMSPPRQTGTQGGLRSLEGMPLTGRITESVLRGIEERRQ